MALPKQSRLGRRDFPPLFRSGRSVRGRACSLRFFREGAVAPKAAVVVQAKVAAGAAERNRIRRVMSEELRPLFSRLKPGSRVAVVVHSPVYRSDPRGYAREAAELLLKSDIITP